MKKSVVILGLACLLSVNANAKDNKTSMMNEEVKSYVGLDYVFSSAAIKRDLQVKKHYDSAAVNIGMKAGDYVGVEGFFQQAAREKKKLTVGRNKSRFYGYGLDIYGYLPLGCEKKLNLLASVGAANYKFDLKFADGSKYNKNRMGYRGGLGVQYDFDDHWAARVMARYTYLNMKQIDNLEEITAGVRYTF